jgi:glutamate racemase
MLAQMLPPSISLIDTGAAVARQLNAAGRATLASGGLTLRHSGPAATCITSKYPADPWKHPGVVKALAREKFVKLIVRS